MRYLKGVGLLLFGLPIVLLLEAVIMVYAGILWLKGD